MVVIGNKIKELRMKLNLTQQEFADLVGISRQSLSNYENEKQEPSTYFIKRIFELYNINLLENQNLEENQLSENQKFLFLKSIFLAIMIFSLISLSIVVIYGILFPIQHNQIYSIMWYFILNNLNSIIFKTIFFGLVATFSISFLTYIGIILYEKKK